MSAIIGEGSFMLVSSYVLLGSLLVLVLSLFFLFSQKENLKKETVALLRTPAIIAGALTLIVIVMVFAVELNML